MISWMQKHKKWLVITIWISTIAFVGAGFVGWGSYDYNKPASSVATVGTKNIKVADLQKEYNNLYSQYQKMFGAQFNKELAKKLNLEKVAYENLVQKYLLLNLADDFGLSATNTEVAKTLVNIPSFIKDGKFDKKIYLQVLKQNRTNPTEFEAGIKQDIILNKLITIFNSSSNNASIKELNKLFFATDKVKINIINSKDFKIKYTQKELKEFWKKTKENYKSLTKYKINIKKLALNSDDKKSKKQALKEYLYLKKGKSKFTKSELIDKNTAYLTSEAYEKISTAKLNKILKPIKIKDGYIIVQLLSKQAPKTLPYDKVKDIVKKDFIKNKTKQLLISKKDALMKNFSGKSLGYISKEKLPKIENLTKNQIESLMQSIFSSTSIVNFVDLGDLVVVYKIEDTKLSNYNQSKDQFLIESINKIKSQTMLNSLINKLRNKYTITTHMKVK